MTRRIKKVVLGAVLLTILGLGALFGSAVPAPIPGLHAVVPAAHADGCDNAPPPPGLDCPPMPTPTPPGH